MYTIVGVAYFDSITYLTNELLMDIRQEFLFFLLLQPTIVSLQITPKNVLCFKVRFTTAKNEREKYVSQLYTHTHTRTHGCIFPHYARQLSCFVISPSLLIEYNSLFDTIQPANFVF